MATEKQIRANRRNAQLSTGPRTEDGKSKSRLNAIRHGLTGQIDVRTPEDQLAHDEFCAAIIQSLDPAAGIERQFAQSIAEDHWRLNRARSIENNIFTLATTFYDTEGETESPEIDRALADARTFIADPARFQLLTVYERRIHSNMTRSLKQLTDLQAARRKGEAQAREKAEAQRARAFEEACLLFQLAESEGQTGQVQESLLVSESPNGQVLSPQRALGQKSFLVDGFVFSTTEIAAAVSHRARLQQARKALWPSNGSPKVVPIAA